MPFGKPEVMPLEVMPPLLHLGAKPGNHLFGKFLLPSRQPRHGVIENLRLLGDDLLAGRRAVEGEDLLELGFGEARRIDPAKCRSTDRQCATHRPCAGWSATSSRSLRSDGLVCSSMFLTRSITPGTIGSNRMVAFFKSMISRAIFMAFGDGSGAACSARADPTTATNASTRHAARTAAAMTPAALSLAIITMHLFGRWACR